MSKELYIASLSPSHLGVVSARGVDRLPHDVQVIFSQHRGCVVNALARPVKS